ncbi:MAG: type II secretion system protein [Rariglobus sp.]|nr:prepilin-type N-terminal cleavage/methylation domain-containing protein [Rariglobus sp.]
MIKHTRRLQAGFTLIELLTVIAIIGILASIIIPTVGKVQQTARRTVDANNLKQIGQASLIFAQANKDQLPGTKLGTGTSFGMNLSTGQAATPKLIAAALAVGGGLETAKLWVSKADDTTSKETDNSNVSNVLNQTKDGLDANFALANVAFGYVAGLTTNYSATTPVAYTRGIAQSATDGKWNANTGTYKSDGGHIVFVGGNVAFYKNLGAATTTGELINSNGTTTNMLKETIKQGKTVIFIEEDNTGTSTTGPAPSGG